MKKLLVLVLFLSSLSFAQRVNPSQLRAPTGTASVTQFLVCVPSSTCAWAASGVVPNPQTGTTYTVLGTDRMKYLSFSNGSAIAVTLPQAGTSGFASNFVFVACDIGAGTATITPTTSTISSSNGVAYTAAAASLALTTGQCAWIYSDNTNYFAIVRAGGTTINATNNILPKRSSATAFTDSALTDNGTTVTSTEAFRAPNGTTASAAYGFASDGATGYYLVSGSTTGILSSNAIAAKFSVASGTGVTTTDRICVDINNQDNCITRLTAKSIAIGSGPVANTTVGVTASYYQSAGTKFTASGCTNSATLGGATAGQYTSGATGACTVTVTMGDTDTATTGWACSPENQTTANLYRQTASTTTTATFSGTTVTGDVITFACIAY